MTLEERIERLENRDVTAQRRIRRLELELKQKPAKKKSAYVPKFKGRHSIAEIENRINQKFLKRTA